MHDDKYKNNYFFNSLVVKNTIYNRKPDYSYAYKLLSRLMRIHKRRLKQHFKEKYNTDDDLTTGFATHVYGHLCMPRVEFKEAIKKIHLNEHLYNSSIRRYYQYVNFSLKRYVNALLHRVVFYVWIIVIRITKGQGKTLVDIDIVSDFRYSSAILKDCLHKHNKEIIPIFSKWSSPYYYKLSFKCDMFSLLKTKCHNNIGAHWLWKVAITLLKPKKIIICDDNSEKTYSLVFAAKQKNVEIIGVSHGHLPPFQAFAYGVYKTSSSLLKFDKFYVWDDVFKKSMLSFGRVYLDKEIFISGWLTDKNYIKKSECINKQYVLYAVEHESADLDAVTACLERFFNNGFTIIIKKRPTSPNIFFKLPFQYVGVEDFSQQHIDCAYCAVGNSSTMIYEFSSVGIPVVTPHRKFDFNMGMDTGFLIGMSELDKKNIRYFEKRDPTAVFLEEFSGN